MCVGVVREEEQEELQGFVLDAASVAFTMVASSKRALLLPTETQRLESRVLPGTGFEGVHGLGVEELGLARTAARIRREVPETG